MNEYWKMRGWKSVTMHQPVDDPDPSDDENFGTVDEVVESINDLFDILSDVMGETDGEMIVVEITVDDGKGAPKEEETDTDAYDRAMKGIK